MTNRQPVAAFSLPMPLTALPEINEAIQRVYGTGETMMSADGDTIRIFPPVDGWGPVKTGRRKPNTVADNDGLLRWHEVRDNVASVTFEEAEHTTLLIGTMVRRWFDHHQAINYVEARLVTEGVDEEFVFTVQKAGNPTAHNLRQVAEAKVAELEAVIAEKDARISELEAIAFAPASPTVLVHPGHPPILYPIPADDEPSHRVPSDDEVTEFLAQIRPNPALTSEADVTALPSGSIITMFGYINDRFPRTVTYKKYYGNWIHLDPEDPDDREYTNEAIWVIATKRDKLSVLVTWNPDTPSPELTEKWQLDALPNRSVVIELDGVSADPAINLGGEWAYLEDNATFLSMKPGALLASTRSTIHLGFTLPPLPAL